MAGSSGRVSWEHPTCLKCLAIAGMRILPIDYCSIQNTRRGDTWWEHGATTMWGAMEWRQDAQRSGHELIQPLCLWSRRGVDLSLCCRHRCYRPWIAGFHTIVLHPEFDRRIGGVDLSYESRYGTIRSGWTARKGGTVWNVKIPANTSARIPIPTKAVNSYMIDGVPLLDSLLVKTVTKNSHLSVYEISAGTYIFTVGSGETASESHAPRTASHDAF